MVLTVLVPDLPVLVNVVRDLFVVAGLHRVVVPRMLGVLEVHLVQVEAWLVHQENLV